MIEATGEERVAAAEEEAEEEAEAGEEAVEEIPAFLLASSAFLLFGLDDIPIPLSEI